MKFSLRVFLLITIIFCNLLVFKVSFAQSGNVSQKGLTVSPIKNNLEIAPGTSINGVLTIANSTKQSMKVDLSAEEFNVTNKHYDYAFTAESNVTKWVSFEKPSIELATGQSQKIKYSINVPLSAEPGGRYLSLFAATNNVNSDDKTIISRQRVASLLYITVTGNITRIGRLVYLSSPVIVIGSSGWSTVLQNKGTTHFESRYEVQIVNILNNETVASSPGSALILPGSLRLVKDELPLINIPGVYKAVYKIGLGDTPSRTEVRLVLFAPWYFIIFVLILVVFMIGYFVYWLHSKRSVN